MVAQDPQSLQVNAIDGQPQDLRALIKQKFLAVSNLYEEVWSSQLKRIPAHPRIPARKYNLISKV
jgi:hypothetical protein